MRKTILTLAAFALLAATGCTATTGHYAIHRGHAEAVSQPTADAASEGTTDSGEGTIGSDPTPPDAPGL